MRLFNSFLQAFCVSSLLIFFDLSLSYYVVVFVCLCAAPLFPSSDFTEHKRVAALNRNDPFSVLLLSPHSLFLTPPTG